MFAVGIVNELSMIYCKLFIVSSVLIASYYLLEVDYKIHSKLSVIVIIIFLSWFVSNLFLQ